MQAKAPVDRAPYAKAPAERPSRARLPAERPSRAKLPAERPSRAKLPAERPSKAKLPAERPSRARVAHEREEREPRRPREPEGGWVQFRFTWGSEHGADPRRLVAMACRRGGIRASDIGAIRVGRTHSVMEVAAPVAAEFAANAGKPDPRDPRVKVRREETRDHEPRREREDERRPMRPGPGGGDRPPKRRR
jgi:ATP-dependent RNA helicase DeaD